MAVRDDSESTFKAGPVQCFQERLFRNLCSCFSLSYGYVSPISTKLHSSEVIAWKRCRVLGQNLNERVIEACTLILVVWIFNFLQFIMILYSFAISHVDAIGYVKNWWKIPKTEREGWGRLQEIKTSLNSVSCLPTPCYTVPLIKKCPLHEFTLGNHLYN